MDAPLPLSTPAPDESDAKQQPPDESRATEKLACVQLSGVLVALGVVIAAMTAPTVAVGAVAGMGVCLTGLSVAAMLDA